MADADLEARAINATASMQPADTDRLPISREAKRAWRMAPLAALPPARLSLLERTWLVVTLLAVHGG